MNDKQYIPVMIFSFCIHEQLYKNKNKVVLDVIALHVNCLLPGSGKNSRMTALVRYFKPINHSCHVGDSSLVSLTNNSKF